MFGAGALFPAFALFIIQSAAAQQPSSNISGRVTSVTGDPLSGVVVRVENAQSGVLTDAQGVYRLLNVPAGDLVLVAQHIGYEPGRRAIAAKSGANSLDFRLTESAVRVDAVVVTASGAAQRQMESSTATGVLTGPELRLAKASHPSELIGRVPGALVTIAGSGEGHMTAIRQPITTNPVYLFLEDGVPTRSTGFFNHNALYEVNVPQAGRIEVLKGPGTALYGSDAIGGVVNVETRAPMLEPGVEYFGEAGGHGWTRALFSAGGTRGADGVRADLNLTRWSGWRQETGYDRQSATLRWDHAFTPGRQLCRGRTSTKPIRRL
jgi:outer membrane receptor protein involved in Fe transport